MGEHLKCSFEIGEGRRGRIQRLRCTRWHADIVQQTVCDLFGPEFNEIRSLVCEAVIVLFAKNLQSTLKVFG